MSVIAPAVEFSHQRARLYDRASAARWIWSHASQYWPILIILVIGAIGNASLAAVVRCWSAAFAACSFPTPTPAFCSVGIDHRRLADRARYPPVRAQLARAHRPVERDICSLSFTARQE
jgi:hypothetical protein